MNAQMTAFPDVNYLVVGLGVTGYSVAGFLLSKGYRCRIQDTRDIPPYLGALKERFEQIDFKASELETDMLDWADVLVVSPGISIRQPVFQQAREQGKQVVGDIELFAQLVQAPVVAITGSNGKSTVTTLVGEMIAAQKKSVAVGGNLGTAALDLLESNADYFVLELSSYQLETTSSLKPAVAALLNISEDHLDRYPDFDAYIEAKQRVFQNASVSISNLDDSLTRHSDTDLRFSLDCESTAEFKLSNLRDPHLSREGVSWLSVSELKISGRHNWANCLAAMAIADSLGIEQKAIVQALKTFTGIPHRSQWVAEIDSVEWVNDSKATNVGAAIASIEGRDRPVILIAGGQSKGADMSLMNAALKAQVKQVLLMGEDALLMQQAWQGVTEIEQVADMNQAVKRAQQIAQPGDCVLLAPACASFDMYEKFEARGDDFIRRVEELKHV
ncbi:MAG: UDP-N-acetylmuramoyl-L-alanine--D-glutamate ligase [Pseudomonadota bacterium]